MSGAPYLAAEVFGGERVKEAGPEGAYYVRPALVEMPRQCGPVLEETYLQAVVRLACEREDLGPDLVPWLKDFVATL